MRLAAVKATHNLFLQPVGFHWVGGLHHLLGQLPQLLRAERRTTGVNGERFWLARERDRPGRTIWRLAKWNHPVFGETPALPAINGIDSSVLLS